MSLWWLVAGDLNTTLGHPTIYTLHRFYILMHRTTISLALTLKGDVK